MAWRRRGLEKTISVLVLVRVYTALRLSQYSLKHVIALFLVRRYLIFGTHALLIF